MGERAALAAATEHLRSTELGGRLPSHLRETRLIRPGDAVVVAVSGGLDSVVLLHLLRFLLGPWRLELTAAHFDHRMRPGSAADGAWVRGLCRAWRVPVVVERATEPLRSEDDARRARYAFLHGVARHRGEEARIATAHHADDQAETVLFRVVRGTGLRGLAGIPRRRGRIVRPLLPFRRSVLAAYGRAAGVGCRSDPTNRSLSYARNRLRHRILPQLDEIAPDAAGALVRLADHARRAEAAWDEVLERAIDDVVSAEDAHGIRLARPRLLAYHPYIRTRLIRRLLLRYGSRPDRAGTRAILTFIKTGASGGRVDAVGDVVIAREFDEIHIRRTDTGGKPSTADRPLRIDTARDGSGRAVIGGRSHAARWTVGTEADGADGAAFDAGRIRFPLELRAWRPGDRIRLSYGTKKLAKLFAEKRIVRSERSRVPILAEVDGRVLWVPDVARAAEPDPAPGEPVFRIRVDDARHD